MKKNVIHIKDAPINFLKKDIDQNGYIYIGRPGIFGNTIVKNKKCFICGNKHITNGSTLDCYLKYLENRVDTDKWFREKVKSLYDKILVCDCAPKPCHGYILASISKQLNDSCEFFE